MSAPILYRSGLIATHNAPPAPGDVLVIDGKISAIAPTLPTPDHGEVRDCSGCILVPGLFDMHVHTREPGHEEEETLASASHAALRGGITGMLAMPNTAPVIDSGALVRFMASLARERAQVYVAPSGCLTRRREGSEMAEIGDMVAHGARLITDDDRAVENPYVLAKALTYALHFEVPIAVHPDTPSLRRGGVMNEGPASYRLGLQGIPACAEEICIERDLQLARHTGGRIHIQQVSTGRGADIIRRFKNEGVAVTAEVSPHHLLLTDEDIVSYDTHFKMHSPLRRPEDAARLLEALNDGTIDAIATGHAPHTEFEKNLDFQHAPFGITGLETALVSLHDRLIRSGALPWQRIVESFAFAPRRILSLDQPSWKPGSPAHFFVFDPHSSTVIERTSMQSRSINTPFLNTSFVGAVREVIHPRGFKRKDA